MSNRVTKIVEALPNAALSIRKDGPPTYRGENPHRIIIDGNPDGLRLLGQLLNLMADTVETNTELQGYGWHFLVNSEAIPQLQLDNGYMLSLNCDPDFNGCQDAAP